MRPRSLTFRSVVASVVLLALVVGAFLVMAVAVRGLQNADQLASRSENVLAIANQLERATIDLESGLRGYLLTGKTRFLGPYEQALTAYPSLARRLERLTAGDPGQQARAQRLERLIAAYVRQWAAPVISLVAHHLAAARRAPVTGGGKRRIDAIRTEFTSFTGRQTRMADAQRRNADHLGTVALTIALAAMIICGLFVLVLAFVLRRLVVLPVRELAEAFRRVRSGILSVRVRQRGTAEVGELTRGFNAMVTGLEEHHDELENQKAELEAQQAELETALETVEEQKTDSELLQRIGDEFARVSAVDEVAAVALREMADFADAELGALYVVADDETGFQLTAHRGLPPAALAPRVIPGEGLAGRAIAEHRPVAMTGGTTLSAPGLMGEHIAAYEQHLPLRHGERTVGVVSLGRVGSEAFGEELLTVLTGLCQRAAMALVEALSRRALESLAHEMQTLLASTGEAIYGTDRNGCITLVNRAALEYTGYTREDLLGQNSHALLHHSHADGSPYPITECPVMWSVANGEGIRIEDDVFWRRDGTAFPVEYSAYPLFEGEQVTGAVVTFTDITARKEAEAQRDTQHAVTRVLADVPSVPEALPALLEAVCAGLGVSFGVAWQPEPDGTGLHAFAWHAQPGWEPDAERLARAGVSREQLPAAAAMLRREPVLCAAPEIAARAGATVTPLQSAVAMPIISLGGELIGVAEFFSDRALNRTGLLATLSSVAGQTAQYIERKRGEAETERMRQEFVATVSHELRTPLTAIDGWLHILLDGDAGPLNAEQQRFLHTVKRNSDRLIRLVGDLLLAGQIESGRLSLEMGDVDLGALTHESVDLVSATAAAKDIAVNVTVAAGVTPIVRGDRSRLMQLLGNLLSNAIKFTPDGGAVDVAVETERSVCTVRVSDSGIGIPPEERSRLFERFFRASTATTNAIAGTGLGLAISRAIAESHGGRIRVGDRPGPGTEFILELPQAIREELPL
jgi:PAS domain S-box-containing protein